jgi:hypothetical protein
MTTKKTTAIKKTSTKTAVPKKSTARDVLVEVHSRGDIGKKPAIRKRLEELEKIEQVKLNTVREWLLDVITIAKEYDKAKTAFREAKYQIISKVYERYIQIESSGELRSQFYNELRKQLLEYGYKVQSNTPDAGLLLRLVLGKSPSSSSINSYVKVLYAAKESAVPKEKIVDWLRELTISGAAKQIPNYEDVRKERVKRARVLLLNYLDWRETHPMLSGRKPMLAHAANQYVTADTHLVVMLGTAVRRFDRESDYADIYISHIMPNNFDIDIKIIDRWARHIEPKLDFYEAEYNALPVEQWSALMEDELWGSDVAEAEKQSINWALRQQATLYEDQQQFAKYAQAYKKQRAKSSKAVKKKS